jgi:chemotaxis protein MotB
MFDDDAPPPTPEWILTYGDMMSLLLTFFIMLASMSELRETDKFQGVAESLQDRFGYEDSLVSAVGGEFRPRNSVYAALALAGRSKRLGALEGRAKEPSAVGAEPRVRMLRPGDRTTIGTVLYFTDDGSAELSEDSQAALGQLAESIIGKPQKIEVRGHTSHRPAGDSNAADLWELSYRRARAVMQFLVERLHIEPQRIRLSVAGPYEPMHLGAGPDQMRENPRVEVFLLDEMAADLVGTPQEQSQRLIDPSP